jgi:hypothetical protein
MKFVVFAAISLTLLATACVQKKSKVCEGCLGNQLADCEAAYESCSTVDHCRRSDIKRKYADGLCVE